MISDWTLFRLFFLGTLFMEDRYRQRCVVVVIWIVGYNTQCSGESSVGPWVAKYGSPRKYKWRRSVTAWLSLLLQVLTRNCICMVALRIRNSKAFRTINKGRPSNSMRYSILETIFVNRLETPILNLEDMIMKRYRCMVKFKLYMPYVYDLWDWFSVKT